jgi:hypothetical protein
VQLPVLGELVRQPIEEEAGKREIEIIDDGCEIVGRMSRV